MIIKGKLEEISAGSWKQGINSTEFLIINGKQHRRISYTDYIKSLLKPGSDIEISLEPPSALKPFGFIWAIKINGVVYEQDLLWKHIYTGFVALGLLLPSFAIGVTVGLNTGSSSLAWFIGLGFLIGLTQLISKKKFDKIRTYQEALRSHD